MNPTELNWLQYGAFGLLSVILMGIGFILKNAVPKLIEALQSAFKDMNGQLEAERVTNKENIEQICTMFKDEVKDIREQCKEDHVRTMEWLTSKAKG